MRPVVTVPWKESDITDITVAELKNASPKRKSLYATIARNFFVQDIHFFSLQMPCVSMGFVHLKFIQV